jgi:hypothetical protein
MVKEDDVDDLLELTSSQYLINISKSSQVENI